MDQFPLGGGDEFDHDMAAATTPDAGDIRRAETFNQEIRFSQVLRGTSRKSRKPGL